MNASDGMLTRGTSWQLVCGMEVDGPIDKLVLMLLEFNCADQTVAELARAACCKASQIREAVARLRDRGLVRVGHVRDGSMALWRLDDDTLRALADGVGLLAYNEPDPSAVRAQPVRRAVLLKMALGEGRVCPTCGTPFTDDGPSSPSVDHIHPQSRGGESTLDNLQIICKRCNTSKGNRVEPPGFLKFWALWPAGARKVDRKGCLKKWLAHRLEAQADVIVASVGVWKKSHEWTKSDGEFVPMPATWLNQERWTAAPEPARPALAVGDASAPWYDPSKRPADWPDALGPVTTSEDDVDRMMGWGKYAKVKAAGA